MIRYVTHREVARLMAEGAPVLDVLPRHEYEAGHIRGATHLPLGRVIHEARHLLDGERPVVVYCRDNLCDLAGRAAAQLEFLGFQRVCHYVRGKADWMVRGMPMEPAVDWGERLSAAPYFVNNLAPLIRAAWIRLTSRVAVAEFTRDDLARLAPDDSPPETAGGLCAVVLDQRGLLLGAIERRSARAARAIDAINPAPQTIRPDMTLGLAGQLLRSNPYLLVTDARGRYLGRYEQPALTASGAPLRNHA